ncbi:MAG: pilus assembly protein FimT [Gammaproteobacteria bacterium HGW-Gammaproteobacteria-13]|nr:MAG: pilus assembly protein FimT [Gammaproteobacteria bacterium HGW-Gammaproteobacteria-13]
MHHLRRTRGFTIVELMITLALIAIVATIAVPNFTQFIRNNQLQAKAEEVKSFLLLARNEAVSNRARVKLEFKVDKNECNDDSTGDCWRIIRPGQANAVIRKLEYNKNQAALAAVDTSMATITELFYYPSGVSSAAARLTICNNNSPETGYLITIAANGSIRLHLRGKDEDNTTALANCE